MRRPTPHVLWAAAVAAVLIAVWLPAAQAPFWQDDYGLLLAARDSRQQPDMQSWIAALAPHPERSFWRPIGAVAWGWFIEGVLGGSARGAHVVGLLLLVAASAAVGWLAATVRRTIAPDAIQPLAPIAAALFYGLHSAHLLPVAWSAAASDSIAVLFGALALRFWVAGSTSGASGVAALGLSWLFLALALLSRENAVVLPALGLLLTIWLWPHRPPPRRALAAGAGGVVLTLCWLVLRSTSGSPDPAYELRFGGNVIRNAASLVLFAVNAPREAIRFTLVDPSMGIAIWGAACVSAQVAAIVILLRQARPRVDRRAAAILLLFFAAACSPFLLLSWNSYEYYVSMGLLAYALLAALAARPSRATTAAAALAALSSIAVIAGSIALDYPAVLARARWGERQLQQIEAWQAEQRLTARPLVVLVEDDHKFQAIGASGIAYRLGIGAADVVVLGPADPVPADRPVIVVPAEGDVVLRPPGRRTSLSYVTSTCSTNTSRRPFFVGTESYGRLSSTMYSSYSATTSR